MTQTNNEIEKQLVEILGVFQYLQNQIYGIQADRILFETRKPNTIKIEIKTNTNDWYSCFFIDDNNKTKNKPEPPKPPLSRIIREGSAGDCPKCHSSQKRNYWGCGKVIGCIQPECDNYYKK